LFSIYFLSSIYSLGYYHGDEHFQIIEFMSYKLGLIPKESLPWEFKERRNRKKDKLDQGAFGNAEGSARQG
jgi:hypothetical protein